MLLSTHEQGLVSRLIVQIKRYLKCPSTPLLGTLVIESA
jgi:hypothetical protein